MSITLYKGDIPADLDLGTMIAVDTEAMGLNNHRDRLCLVQMSGDGNTHLVQLSPDDYDAAPNLKALLADQSVTKIFQFARFDVAIIRKYLGVDCTPVYCTKIASKLARTYTDRHGLRDLCRELAGVDISKQQQSSDWGQEELSEEQLEYAASDVLYLHTIKERLDQMVWEGRQDLAQSCFLDAARDPDLEGWGDLDIFSH